MVSGMLGENTQGGLVKIDSYTKKRLSENENIIGAGGVAPVSRSGRVPAKGERERLRNVKRKVSEIAAGESNPAYQSRTSPLTMLLDALLQSSRPRRAYLRAHEDEMRKSGRAPEALAFKKLTERYGTKPTRAGNVVFNPSRIAQISKEFGHSPDPDLATIGNPKASEEEKKAAKRRLAAERSRRRGRTPVGAEKGDKEAPRKKTDLQKLTEVMRNPDTPKAVRDAAARAIGAKRSTVGAFLKSQVDAAKQRGVPLERVARTAESYAKAAGEKGGAKPEQETGEETVARITRVIKGMGKRPVGTLPQIGKGRIHLTPDTKPDTPSGESGNIPSRHRHEEINWVVGKSEQPHRRLSPEEDKRRREMASKAAHETLTKRLAGVRSGMRHFGDTGRGKYREGSPLADMTREEATALLGGKRNEAKATAEARREAYEKAKKRASRVAIGVLRDRDVRGPLGVRELNPRVKLPPTKPEPEQKPEAAGQKPKSTRPRRAKKTM